jgi:hypothetical protein
MIESRCEYVSHHSVHLVKEMSKDGWYVVSVTPYSEGTDRIIFNREKIALSKDEIKAYEDEISRLRQSYFGLENIVSKLIAGEAIDTSSRYGQILEDIKRRFERLNNEEKQQ